MDVLHEVIVSFLLVGHTGNEGSLQNDNSYDKVSHTNKLFQKLLLIINWFLILISICLVLPRRRLAHKKMYIYSSKLMTSCPSGDTFF